MKITSIQTPIGAALLADHSQSEATPIGEVPSGYGVVLYGRDRSSALVAVFGLQAAWLAEYQPKTKQAIVLWSWVEKVNAGDLVEIESLRANSAICPACGSADYTSSGTNWRCSNCGKQWRKSPKTRGRKPSKKNEIIA